MPTTEGGTFCPSSAGDTSQGEVYTLEFAGDYQTGEYDTDAAENVAYDKNTKRAFLAF